jgi:hypothetical protein
MASLSHSFIDVMRCDLCNKSDPSIKTLGGYCVSCSALLKPTVSSHSSVETKDNCTICTESMASGRSLTCGHVFHSHCIERWLMRKNSCPICRTEQPVEPVAVVDDNPYYNMDYLTPYTRPNPVQFHPPSVVGIEFRYRGSVSRLCQGWNSSKKKKCTFKSQPGSMYCGFHRK